MMATLLLVDLERNAAVDLLASRIAELSLHTYDPGVTGVYEVVGGAPVYARRPVVFTPAGQVGVLGDVAQPATAGVAWSDQVAFDAPAGTYTYWGAWGSSVFRMCKALDASRTLPDQGLVLVSVGLGPVVPL